MKSILPVSTENLGTFAMETLEKECLRGWSKRRYEGLRNQRLIAEHNRAQEWKSLDGIGGMELSLDPEVYFYWIQKEGPQFWRDKKNRKWIAERFPQTKVKSGGTKAQVGWGAPCQ